MNVKCVRMLFPKKLQGKWGLGQLVTNRLSVKEGEEQLEYKGRVMMCLRDQCKEFVKRIIQGSKRKGQYVSTIVYKENVQSVTVKTT